MKKSGAFLWGLLIGIAAGAVAGVLLAPDKGSVTREKLKKKAEGIKEEYEDILKASEEVSNQFEDHTDEDADFEKQETKEPA